MALIFARDLTGPLTSLVKQLDEAIVKQSDEKMGGFVVFLNDSETIEERLKDLSDKEGLKQMILGAMSSPTGPPRYKIAKDASVTVLLYTKQKVVEKFVFGQDQLSDKDIEKILRSLPKILPEK